MTAAPPRAGTRPQTLTRLTQMCPRVLLPASMFLWSIGLRQATLNIGPYGLIHSLPPPFFAALVMLNLSFLAALRSRPPRSRLLAAHVLAFVAFVDLTPIILEGTPRFPYVYSGHGYADYIVRNGHLNMNLVQHNWPGLHLLNAVILQVSGIGPTDMLLWSTLAVRALGLLVFRLIFRRLCESREEAWTALWLYVLFSGGPGYLLPGHFAGILMVSILSLAVAPVLGRARPAVRAVGYQILLVILISAVAPAHLLTSAVVVIDLAVLYIVARVAERRQVALNTTTLAAVLLLCWLFYVAVNTTIPLLLKVLNEALRLDVVLAAAQRAAFGGSSAHTTVVLVRVGYVVTLSVLGLAGFLRRFISERALRLPSALPAAWVAASISLVLLTSYSGEILSRAYAFCFFSLLILAAKHVRGAAFPVLSAIVLVAAVFYPVNVWGNERVDYVPASEIRAADFFYQRRPSRYAITAYPVRIWNYKYLEESGAGDTHALRFTVVGVSSQQHQSFLQGNDQEPSQQPTGPDHSARVYTGGSADILVQYPEVTP